MIVKTISVQELKSAIDSGEEIELLDVREEEERAEAHIGGLFIPLAQLPLQWEQIASDKKVVVYCRSGGRSHYAVDALQRECGLENLYNLDGGIMAWLAAGFPTKE